MWKYVKTLIGRWKVPIFFIIAITASLILAVVCLVPLVVFWSVETLFDHKIDYNLNTIIAFWVLYLFVSFVFSRK